MDMAGKKNDWKQYVRDHLQLVELNAEREMVVIEELAAHLATAYEEALSAGKTEEEAWAQATALISNWRALSSDLARSERKVSDLMLAKSYAIEDRIVQAD